MHRTAARLILGLLLLAAGAGCEKKLRLPRVVNQRPIVTLTQAPSGGATRYWYSYELRWSGFDPDGQVDHFLYCVDPPTRANADTPWVSTTDNRKTLTFSSGDPDSLGDKFNPGGFHVFAIKAVDNQGLASLPVSRAFFSFTVAPDVRVTSPQPNSNLRPAAPPSLTISWSGHDPDGVTTNKPVKYKFKMFRLGNPDFDILTMVQNPDSLRRYYAPSFAGWDSTTDTSFAFTALTPSTYYVFAVVAFDEAGAYSPIFSTDTNMLFFRVTYAGIGGPILTIFNQSFDYTYSGGGYSTDPSQYINIEVAAGAPVHFFWSATAAAYSSMKQYRWCLDNPKLDDYTPRTTATDFQHWSDPGLTVKSAIVGPFAGLTDTTHFFYVEAEDNNGIKSLGIVAFKVVRATFDKPLLFVNDTRFSFDQLAPGSADSIAAPQGLWPSVAELDTFLFARGGMPWKYYPPGSLSPTGIFSAYSYDTIGTLALPGGNFAVPLSLLAHYRHVVWMVDQVPTFGTSPSSLGLASLPNHSATLGNYSSLGGTLWLMGGGAAYETLLPYNITSNDLRGATVFSLAAGELVPGRFMFDLAHWQSEISVLQSLTATVAPRFPAWAGAPDYASLPPAMVYRTAATDPIWPERGFGSFYNAEYEAEYLTKPNSITEQVRINADSVATVSMLDTLYYTSGQNAGNPVMTYYHGVQNGPFLFSGFPLWNFQRAHAQALGDWVLQKLWGLSPSAPSAPSGAARLRPFAARPSRRGAR